MTTAANPFASLGIAPTLDTAAVKRAYFQQLARHPPHQDPEGFRRLRSDYETLGSPGGLAAAYLAAPLDLDAEAARYCERFDAALAAARSRIQPTTPRGRQFFATAAFLTYLEASKRFST
jgi:hypothetical protein